MSEPLEKVWLQIVSHLMCRLWTTSGLLERHWDLTTEASLQCWNFSLHVRLTDRNLTRFSWKDFIFNEILFEEKVYCRSNRFILSENKTSVKTKWNITISNGEYIFMWNIHEEMNSMNKLHSIYISSNISNVWYNLILEVLWTLWNIREDGKSFASWYNTYGHA